MKQIRILKIGLIACCIAISINGYGQEKDMRTHFNSEVEAANKGKADLIEVLKSNRNINLGVKLEDLEGSSTGKPITRMLLKFDNLLNLDNVRSLKSISESESTTIVPFLKGGMVVTVVEVANDKEGWVVVGLAGMSMANDLNSVMKVVGEKPVTVYEVPNLEALIYTIQDNDRESYLTTLNERFSLRMVVTREELYPELQKAAREFQDMYGDMLKKEKLVR